MIALMKSDTGRKLVTCSKAAQIYRCSMRYIRRLAADGRIYSEVVGRTYMVDEADVRKLAARQEGGRLRKRSNTPKSG
jgi:excisionase family DNA binding protein